MTKICTGCFCEKALTAFEIFKVSGGTRGKCKDCRRQEHVLWHNKNSDKACAYLRAWYKKNRDMARQGARRRYTKNAEHICRRNSAWYKKNRATVAASKRRWRKRDGAPQRAYHLKQNLRKRILDALSGKAKSAPTLILLGCSIPEFRAHLEKQFKPGMSWENYGPAWHIDHRRPCAAFDLSDPAQQRACFHFSNQQPLWAIENLVKGDKC